MDPTTTGLMSTGGPKIRQLKPDDYEFIISRVNDWWGGREMRDMLPKLFFIHFCGTSFVAECEGKITGFLVGFVSQCHPDQAYIHFSGVDPLYRKHKLGSMLYANFFFVVAGLGCSSVHCVTSPVNRGSIAFHRAIGFEVEHPGGGSLLPFAADYDGLGEHRVLFKKTLGLHKYDNNQ